MDSGGMWKPRMTSSAERIYSEVEYISSDERNYLDFDLRVRYEPEGSPSGRSTRMLFGENPSAVVSKGAAGCLLLR